MKDGDKLGLGFDVRVISRPVSYTKLFIIFLKIVLASLRPLPLGRKKGIIYFWQARAYNQGDLLTRRKREVSQLLANGSLVFHCLDVNLKKRCTSHPI